MQKVIFSAIVSAWLILSGVISRVITGGSRIDGLLLIWLLIALTPFLLRPLNGLQRCFNPSACMLRRHAHRTFVHLSPFQPTVGLSPARVEWFWQGVNHATAEALKSEQVSVVISSHLLTASRIRRFKAYLPLNHCRTHVIHVPFTPLARAVMQLEILFAQWRWRVPSRTTWPVLIIRKKSLRAK